jgi:hypothetical protein
MSQSKHQTHKFDGPRKNVRVGLNLKHYDRVIQHATKNDFSVSKSIAMIIKEFFERDANV